MLLSYKKKNRAQGGIDSANLPPIINTSAPDTNTTQSFTAATFAAVTIPTGATGVIVVPPDDNTGNITQKGITGDTGNSLGAITEPFYLPLASGASLGFLCVNAIALEFVWC